MVSRRKFFSGVLGLGVASVIPLRLPAAPCTDTLFARMQRTGFLNMDLMLVGHDGDQTIHAFAPADLIDPTGQMLIKGHDGEYRIVNDLHVYASTLDQHPRWLPIEQYLNYLDTNHG